MDGPETRKQDTTVVKKREASLQPILWALGGLIALLLLLWLFTGKGNPDQDKLTGAETNASEAAADPQKRCASKATYELIKRELFRRAAQVRGSDQAAFDKLAGYAVVRMENPVLEGEDSNTGAANCSGTLSLDLPPGVAVVGGRRTLTTDVDYTLQRAADGSGDVVLLRNADPIVTPLATLARTAEPQQAPADEAITGNLAGALPDTPAPLPPPDASRPQASPAPEQPTRPVGARPSFDCDDARTRGEIAVCSDAGLAALDRTMAAQYGRAVDRASPAQREILRQTRDRFLAYRDRCPNRACVGDAYTGRMREIRDIMEGRWRPR